MKLKPCPFCGQQPQVTTSIHGDTAGNWVQVECGNRKCPVSAHIIQFADGWRTDEKSIMRRAARKWNQRAEVQP